MKTNYLYYKVATFALFSFMFVELMANSALSITSLSAKDSVQQATQDNDSLKAVNLNRVVVTANKARVNRSNVPLTISVIERAEIETAGGSSVLPVLSQLVPGLFVTQKGMLGFGVASGSAGVINIRGVGQGSKVLMLFDGQPQWAGVFGHSIPDLYLSSDVERVEVIRGPGSLMYGSNAMGGVVNIISRSNLIDGRFTKARLSYGAYNTARFMVNNSYNSGKFSSFISLNHDRTGGHRNNSKFNITNGLAKVGYKLNNYFNLNAHISLAKIYNENPGKVGESILDNKMDIIRSSASLAIENSHKYGSGAVKLFFNSGDHLIDDGYSLNEMPKTYLFNSADHNYGIMVYESLNIFSGNSFTIGFDYKNWGGKAWNEQKESGVKNYLADRATYETAGYFIVDQEFLEMLTLSAGLRFEYNSSFGDAWIPQIGLSLRPIQGSVVKASISKGYKSPTIKEMYMFPPQNPYLMPENMINYELSIGQTFLDSKVTAELNLFYIDGWNMIETVIINGIPKNLNTGYFNNNGVELQVSYRVKPQLKFDFNYSFLKTSKPMVSAPTHKLFAAANYSHDKLLLNANIQYIGDMYINTATKAKENYILLNLHASYKVKVMGLDTRVFINGNNITGTSYSVIEGFPMPGATALFGIDVSF